MAAGIVRELTEFADLVRSLDKSDLARPSRCEAWTAGDVAAHLIGAFADITSGRIEGQGTPEASERQVVERRGRTAVELAEELDQVAERTGRMLAGFDDAAWTSQARGGYDMTLAQAMLAMWSGANVHADDIRAAIGRPSERGAGLRASVRHVANLLTQQGWGPALLALDGLDEMLVSGPSGSTTHSLPPRIAADPLTFVLAATGRTDPVPLGLDPSVNVFAR